jgi:hypothetical protein
MGEFALNLQASIRPVSVLTLRGLNTRLRIGKKLIANYCDKLVGSSYASGLYLYKLLHFQAFLI